MPIFNKRKLCFIHIPKNAGSTIEKALDMKNKESLYEEKWHEDFLVCPQHLTFLELSTLINIENYQVFSVVRNPFDRLVSEFGYFYKNNHRVCGKSKEPHPFELKTDISIFKNITFKDFVDVCFNIEYKERKWLFDGHLEPQVDFIKGETSMKIFKYENINECFEWLRKFTNIDLQFGNENRSQRKDYVNYYLKDTHTLDTDLIEKVGNFYKEDILRFGYSFEGIKNPIN